MVDEPRRPAGPETPESGDGRVQHPLVHYERTDINYRWIFGLIGCAILFALTVHVALWWFMMDDLHSQGETKKSPFPLAPSLSPKVPPEPRPTEGVASWEGRPVSPSTLPPEPRLEQIDRLSGLKRTNAAALEAPKEAALQSYGPTADQGFVHIPIEQAMQRLANKLPAQPEPPPDQAKQKGQVDKDNGLVDAGAPNSGRVFRRRPQ